MILIEVKKTFNKIALVSSLFSLLIFVSLLLSGVTALAQGSAGAYQKPLRLRVGKYPGWRWEKIRMSWHLRVSLMSGHLLAPYAGSLPSRCKPGSGFVKLPNMALRVSSRIFRACLSNMRRGARIVSISMCGLPRRVPVRNGRSWCGFMGAAMSSVLPI